MNRRMNRGAQLLRRWLEERDQSQAALAAVLAKLTGTRLNQSTVSGWLRGNHIPRGECLVALQLHCGIDLTNWTRPAVERGALAQTEGGGS
jgi:hypothetical protein